MSVGFVLPVLNFMRDNNLMIDQVRSTYIGTHTCMDPCLILLRAPFVPPSPLPQALLRHFVGLGLSMASPPYSEAFSKSMIELLVGPKLQKAMSTLPPDKRELLHVFVTECLGQKGLIPKAMRPAAKKLLATRSRGSA